MITRIRKGGYLSEEIDGVEESFSMLAIPGLKDLVWAYVQSNSEISLNINRQTLASRLRPKEVAYVKETCVPKEE